MEAGKGTGRVLMSLAVIAMAAILAAGGCMESAPQQQGPSDTAGVVRGGSPAATAATAAPAKTAAVPSAPLTTRPIPSPISSTGVIKMDPVTDKNYGDKFTLTGTTSLPAGTEIFWQILQDTGSPPADIDKESTMAVGGNNLVTRGEGTINRIEIAVDMGRLVPGKYVALVGKAKDHKQDEPGWEIGTDFAYASFSLK